MEKVDVKQGDEFTYKKFNHILFKIKKVYPMTSSMIIEALVFIPSKRELESYRKKE